MYRLLLVDTSIHAINYGLKVSRKAWSIHSAAYQRSGSRDEGSVLGGLGNILSGDRNF